MEKIVQILKDEELWFRINQICLYIMAVVWFIFTIWHIIWGGGWS